MKIAILGAGPAGLTIAHRLAKHDFEVDVYDQQSEVGGFARSFDLWGRRVEIGPHFLNAGIIPRVHQLVREVIGNNCTAYPRQTYIMTHNKLFCYPPKMSDMIKKMRFDHLCHAAGSYLLRGSEKQNNAPTAEAFVKQRLGSGLYHYFFESFSKKLWGLNGSQVSDLFAKSLLGFNNGHTPLKMIRTKLNHRFNSDNGRHIYLYPNNGLSSLWQSMKLQARNHGCNFFMGSRIRSICSIADNKLSLLTMDDGTQKSYDAFISTIPLQAFTKLIDTPLSHSHTSTTSPANFRNDVLVYLKVDVEASVKGQCFYCYAENTMITRITDFDEFTPNVKHPFKLLLVEFWCASHDDIWKASDSELLRITEAELSKCGIFKKLNIVDMHVKKVPNAFQVPDLSLLENRNKLFDELAVYDNLFLTGRSASLSFNYGMENAMDDGLSVADELIQAFSAMPQAQNA